MTRAEAEQVTDIIKGEAPALSPFLHSPVFHLETLKSRQLFKDSAGGPRYATPAFTMLRRPVSEAEAAAAGEASSPARLRFGFTVTKKIGGAVERNRIRRRLKAAVCSASPEFPDIRMDIVILARKEAMGIGFSALVRDIARSVAALGQRPAGRKPAITRNSTAKATKAGET